MRVLIFVLAITITRGT